MMKKLSCIIWIQPGSFYKGIAEDVETKNNVSKKEN